MSQIVGKPLIANVTMTSQNTEYSYDIPAGTKRFEIKLRAINAIFKLAFISGASGSTYMSIPYGASYVENDIKGGPITLYFQSPSNTQVAEIKTWK